MRPAKPKIDKRIKTCPTCHKVFRDASKRNNSKYCSEACRYTPKRSRYLSSSSYAESWTMPELCKRCGYRKLLTSSRPVNYNTDENWSWTYCSYHETEGDVRGCLPDDNCFRFVPGDGMVFGADIVELAMKKWSTDEVDARKRLCKSGMTMNE